MITVALGDKSYDIVSGEISALGSFIKSKLAPSSVAIITDSNVAPLYADAARSSIEKSGFKCEVITFPAGEENKTTKTLLMLWDKLLANKIDRKGLIVALGGGVTGDLSGFAASSVLRGIDFIQVPTTLLACVDSSVGGKTGIDSVHGKNLIGAFYQPKGVMIDAQTLKTLPPREVRAGLAEVIKTGVIRSKELFEFIENNYAALLNVEPEPTTIAVQKCCAIKAEVVSKDELDLTGLRAILNFGHTLGHAIESTEGLGQVLHGEGVAIGMVAAGRIAVKMGLFDNAEQLRIESLIKNCELPHNLKDVKATNAALIEKMGSDKKNVASKIYFVLPESIGAAKLLGEAIDLTLVDEVLTSLRK